MSAETLRLWLPIGLSALSLCLASFSLGWNVYRDLVLKARIKVELTVVSIVSPGQPESLDKHYVHLRVTNHGPGKVRLTTIVGKVAPLWRRLAKRVGHFVVSNDPSNPYNSRLPITLEVGDSADLHMRYDSKSVLNSNATHVGVSDSFGRHHYASRQALNIARQQFRKDFADATARDLAEKW